MLTPRRPNPNVEESQLILKYSQARRIRPYTEVKDVRERGPVARPTNVRIKLAGVGDSPRTYIYFDDGSLRRYPPVLRGKAAIKAAKRRRQRPNGGR